MLNNNQLDTYARLDKSYYRINIRANDLFSDDMATCNRRCRAFIKRHFDNGKKEEALCLPWDREYCEHGKHVHTVSLYLLGLSMQGLFEDSVKNRLNLLIPTVNEWYDFKYTWFLTCLYHDVASSIEKSQIRINPSDAEKQLPYYLGNMNIQYTPFNYVPQKRGIALTRFSEWLIENYFRYRAENQSFEHGIIGGYYLFDRLCKSFYTQTEGFNWDQQPNYIQDNLSWRLEHLDHFAYICDTIICHNLWTAKSGRSAEKYKDYGLSSLIIHNEKERLDFSGYPLHFLLNLLDSVEPVKRFKQESAKNVLQKVSICMRCNNGEYSLEIAWDESLTDTMGYSDWIKSIRGTEEWLSVNVDADSINDHKIELFFTENPHTNRRR